MNHYRALRPLIFKLDPETAHRLVVRLLRLGGTGPLRPFLKRLFRPPENAMPVQAFGLTFSNPVGVAAGFDKDGHAYAGLACLGFGHIEVGTVTLRPQAGNPRPRIFRLVEDQAVINRMGFNNDGAERLAARLERHPVSDAVIGVNIGKNKDTPQAEAAADYLALLEIFAPLAGYLAINVSSPNTPGLRSLQAANELEALLSTLHARRQSLQKDLGRSIPLLVKLAPDLSDAEFCAALDVIVSTGMDGAILCNTTVERNGLRSASAQQSGGLSGAPLRSRALALLKEAVRRTNGRLALIASGGILTAEDAAMRMDAGASLVQVYTGMIYAGPGIARSILVKLSKH